MQLGYYPFNELTMLIKLYSHNFGICWITLIFHNISVLLSLLYVKFLHGINVGSILTIHHSDRLKPTFSNYLHWSHAISDRGKEKKKWRTCEGKETHFTFAMEFVDLVIIRLVTPRDREVELFLQDEHFVTAPCHFDKEY